MKTFLRASLCLLLGLGTTQWTASAQTTGTARLEVTLLDYTGTSGASHYTVAWVTTEAGVFIKSLRKQGPTSWTSSEWASHCGAWNSARAGKTVLDGYTSATAKTYSGTNSPVVLTWNCADASDTLVADGNYKFWVQYAENSGQGPYTTSGLVWTKGPVAKTNTYPNQGVNFSAMKVTWTPNLVPVSFTSVQVSGNNLVISGSGPANGGSTLLGSTEAEALPGAWTTIESKNFGETGLVRYTNAISVGAPRRFFKLKVP